MVETTVSEQQIETRLAALLDVANKIHNRLERLLNLYGEKSFFHKVDILEINRDLLSDILTMSIYLPKSSSKTILFIIYSINNATQIPDDASVDLSLRECYYITVSLEVARQTIKYHIINKAKEIVLKDNYLNVPFYK